MAKRTPKGLLNLIKQVTKAEQLKLSKELKKDYYNWLSYKIGLKQC